VDLEGMTYRLVFWVAKVVLWI